MFMHCDPYSIHHKSFGLAATGAPRRSTLVPKKAEESPPPGGTIVSALLYQGS